MLTGRDAELQDIDELLRQATVGGSGVLVLRGDPGIGKTALVDYAARHAGPMRVLRATGIEAESELGFAGVGLPCRDLAGLSPDATERLVETIAGTKPASGVARRLHAETGGNPLALVELSATLTAAQLGGAELPEAPLEPGTAIRLRFAARLDRLSAPARTALLVAAAAGRCPLPDVTAVAGQLALADHDVFAEAETAGLIYLARGGVEFSHPLVRSVAYHLATRPSAGPHTWRWPASCPGGTPNVPPGTWPRPRPGRMTRPPRRWTPPPPWPPARARRSRPRRPGNARPSFPATPSSPAPGCPRPRRPRSTALTWTGSGA